MADARAGIASHLDDAENDLLSAEALLGSPKLVAAGNRTAAYHLQQAAEKLVKAVRLHRGLLATKEHRIDVLVGGVSSGEPKPLPAGDPWIPKLLALDALSVYATAFRYPTPSGVLKAGPDSAAATTWIAKIRPLIGEARADLLGA